MFSDFINLQPSLQRQRVWNLENILSQAEVFTRELSARAEPPSVLNLSPPTLRSSPFDDLEAFFIQLSLLEITTALDLGISAFNTAREILIASDVRWGSSRNDFLWAELFSRLGEVAERSGEVWLGGFLKALLPRELRLTRLTAKSNEPANYHGNSLETPNTKIQDQVLTGDWLRDRAALKGQPFALSTCEYLLSLDPTSILSETSWSPQQMGEVRLLGHLTGDSMILKRTPMFSTLARKAPEATPLRYLANVEKTLTTRSLQPSDWLELGREVARFLRLETSLRLQALTLAWIYRVALTKRNPGLANFILKSYFERTRQGSDPYRLLGQQDSAERSPTPSVHSLWHRSASVVNLTSEIMLVLGQERFRNIFRSRRLNLTSSERMLALKTIARELGRLRGPMMKLGQMASYLTDDLSDSEKSLFEFLWSQAPALAYAQIHESIPADLLANVKLLDPVPIGTGSVSQVHHGILNNGDEVAAKILLPGIEQAISADMRLLRTILPLGRVLTPGVPLKELYQEIAEKLALETDLLSEARAIETLRLRFHDYPDIYLPRVYPEKSFKNVLLMSFEHGQTLDEFIATASQEERDRAGVAIVRFVVTSVRDRFFSADPHPGNYLFNHGRVTFLDFGSFVDWDSRTSAAWNDLILAFLRYDFELYIKALESLRCIEPRAKESELRAIFDIFAKPQKGFLKTGEYGSLDSRVTTAQLRGMMAAFKTRSPIKLYPKFLFGLRIYLGHLNVVARLGARHNWTELVSSIFQDQ